MSKKKQKHKYDTTLPSDAELLTELATLDEVETYIPTEKDHTAQVVPPWCELLLTIKRDDPSPIHTRIPLRRHDGELIIEVLWQVLHPEASTSASSAMYDLLDKVYDKIMFRVAKGKQPRVEDVSQALGIAKSIAIMVNPVKPDVDEVRAVAVERYEARHN